MAIDFPDTPTLNQEFTQGDKTWIWNGSAWDTSTTQIIDLSSYATMTDVNNAIAAEISGLVGTAPASLNTIQEIANSINNDANFYNTISSTFAPLSNAVLSSPTVSSVKELVTINTTAPTGTVNVDLLTSSVVYFSSNTSANFTLNFRGNSSNTLNSIMSVGQSLTAAIFVTNGSTAYYPNVIQVDGSNITPKWQGGTVINSGNANSIDVYGISFIKTAPGIIVFASQAKFA